MIDRSKDEVDPIVKAPKRVRSFGGLPRMRTEPRNRKGVSGVVKTSLTKRSVDDACRRYRISHPKCELAGVGIPCANYDGSPATASTETHHRRERSACGYLDDERNMLAVCKAHHDWVTAAGRAMAKAAGWLVELEDPGYFDLGPDDRRDQ